jgi:hypothetical protein
MRSKEVIVKLSPCDTNLQDPTLITIRDAKTRAPIDCSNLIPCKQEGISCSRLIAKQMAKHLLKRVSNGQTLPKAISLELPKVQESLDQDKDGKLWTYRAGKWKIIKKSCAGIDIVSFAKTIIDPELTSPPPLKKPILPPEED